MICELCEKNGGFEGDPPEEAVFVVTITAPEGPAQMNPPEYLCGSHTQIVSEGLIGYGWSIHVDFIDEPEPLSPERRFRLYTRLMDVFREAGMDEAADTCRKIASQAARESPEVRASMEAFLAKLRKAAASD